MHKKTKRQLKQALSVFTAAALLLTSVPSEARTSKKKAVTKIQLTAPYSAKDKKITTTLTLKKGRSFQIKARVFPASASKKLVYKSSKKKVASVSKSGKIKAKKTGKTTITIRPKKNKKIKAVIKVTVVKKLKKVKKITLSKKSLSLTLEKGKNSAKLKARVKAPKKPTTKKFNWFSSNKKVASVSKKGVVTAKKTGNAKIIVTSADGRGAKATCKVTVTRNSSHTPTPAPTKTSGTVPSKAPGRSPSPSPSATAKPYLSIVVPGKRTGIKQGENLQLTAEGIAADKVKWSVSDVTGVSISETGLLTIASNAAIGKTVNVTAISTTDSKLSDSVSFKIIENQTSPLTEKQLQLNQSTEKQPYGLNYRSDKAVSIVSDPERGDVVRFDSSVGYKNEMLAYMLVDPMYAGKKVTISAYVKYDKLPNRDTIGLVLNERWDYTNPAVKWNAEPDTWYFIKGEYTLPADNGNNYKGDTNYLFLSKFSDLAANENAVYYIDDLSFTIEKANVTGVSLSTAGNATEIYQNHTLQCSSVVKGEGNPLQKVNYTIEPAVEGASIDENGLLTVKNAAAGSKINIKAASIEDPEQYDTKTVTVLAQTIDSLSISAEGSPTEIYQGNTLKLTTDITSTGEPDTSVTWSVTPNVSGVTISKDGLLAVGNDVPGDTVLTIQATSVFDKTTKANYPITVRANKINGVTVKSAGDKTTIAAGDTLNLAATLDTTGTPSKDVTWSIPQSVTGASLSSEKGSNNTLSVNKDVTEGTSITVRATSDFDTTKYGELTITVGSASTEEFDINKLSVEYFENFDGENTTLDTIKNDGVFSWQATDPTDPTFDPGLSVNLLQNLGIHKTDENLTLYERGTNTFLGFFGNKNDYLQFKLKNTNDTEKTYTLSFLFRFLDIDADSSYIKKQMKTNVSYVEYKLPLKLVSIDETGSSTQLKDIKPIPFRCARYTSDNPEYYSIESSITVPANKTINIRLMLAGDLPTCLSPNHTAENADFANTPHPCTFTIDNIAISSGNLPTISLNAGEAYQLKLGTVETDTVKYYTNSYLAQFTHKDSETEPTCTRFKTTVADVDGTGKITANTAGDTALIAEITHQDGKVERKQCIVHVK